MLSKAKQDFDISIKAFYPHFSWCIRAYDLLRMQFYPCNASPYLFASSWYEIDVIKDIKTFQNDPRYKVEKYLMSQQSE